MFVVSFLFLLYIPRARSPAFSHEISNPSVDGGTLSACLHSFRFFWAIFVVLALGIGYVLVGICESWLCLRFVGRIVCFLLPFRSVFVFLSPSHVIHSLCLFYLWNRILVQFPGMLLVRWNNIEVCRFCGLHPTLRSATEFQCGCSCKKSYFDLLNLWKFRKEISLLCFLHFLRFSVYQVFAKRWWRNLLCSRNCCCTGSSDLLGRPGSTHFSFHVSAPFRNANFRSLACVSLKEFCVQITTIMFEIGRFFLSLLWRRWMVSAIDFWQQ